MKTKGVVKAKKIRLKVDAALWLKLLQTLYPPAFGTVGALVR